MIAIKTEKTTRELGKPVDWNEHTDEPCESLPVEETTLGDLPVMYSTWIMTHEERIKLLDGGKIILGVVGKTHPPVSMTVE